MKKNYTIKPVEGAFNKDVQAQKISHNAMPFCTKLAEASRFAEELDRYDDFAALKITIDQYKKRAGANGSGEYGIPFSEIHRLANTNKVILDHQKRAALLFLSELRGFGLLADVVGSGKTFEACLVLSELAARGKLNSLLLVVPSQTYQAWKEVLEIKFGLGKGALADLINPIFEDGLEDINYKEEILKRPLRPTIVKTEDFVKWQEANIKNILFDAVVVDEAHHLCLEEGGYAKALKLLSYMMVTKRKVNSTYCLLLSATPHSGNLEKMFRLWYFIRCKGGNPADFEEKDDIDRSDDYRHEKKFYLNTVCRGAATVAEYIAVSKRYEIEGYGVYIPEYKEDYLEFLKEKLGNTYKDDYGNMSEGERRLFRDKFLNNNLPIKKKVLSRIADSYHNGVMRSIMIRQPNNLPKSIKAINYFFYPVKEKLPPTGTHLYEDIEFAIRYKDMYAKNAIVGKRKSITEFSKQISQHDENDTYAEVLISVILNDLGSFNDTNIFSKQNSLQYYWEQFREMKMDDIDNIIRIADGYNNDIFDYKIEQLLQIIRDNPKERIILFFEYDIPKYETKTRQWERVFKVLKEHADIKNRIIFAAGVDNVEMSNYKKEEYLSLFEKKEDAVFIAGDSAFTEGVNMQQGSIIVNFEVTPDPLAMDQRIGRVYRLGQLQDVKIISFAAMNKLEGYSLAYFNRIGLMHNTTGDATIIAGSNNEHMVAVQCPACERVHLYSEVEFSERKNKDRLRCDAEEKCRLNDPSGTIMEEINVYEFKCDKCGEVLSRKGGNEGYKCFATNNKKRGKLNNFGELGNRKYYCSKYCVINHCKRFEKDLAEKCLILKKYKNKLVEPDFAVCKLLCYKCPIRGTLCPEKCSMMHETMEESIAGCADCDYAECIPKPHVIEFDENWHAKCPKQGCDGTLRPIVSRTFAAYIKAAYAFKADGGSSFCKNFLDEAKKTDDLKVILESDSLSIEKG